MNTKHKQKHKHLPPISSSASCWFHQANYQGAMPEVQQNEINYFLLSKLLVLQNSFCQTTSEAERNCCLEIANRSWSRSYNNNNNYNYYYYYYYYYYDHYHYHHHDDNNNNYNYNYYNYNYNNYNYNYNYYNNNNYYY